ncbi:MAG: DNA-processing protein DprA [Parcubacteria group bacterium]|jgi:DNA processing protein
MPNKNDLVYLNALHKINGVGPQKMRKLMEFFPSAEAAWSADIFALGQSGVGEALAAKIFSQRKEIDPQQEWAKLEKEQVRMLTETDEDYPRLLREIPSAPYVLYMKGEMDLNAPMISIVGSRKHSDYGSQAAYALAKDLAQAGITVVSGMAYGIDSIAHRGALDGGGKTIAVLGNSLDEKNIYPVSNLRLSREISGSGCLLSNYPIETPAGIPGNFPARNRLIAGLSMGTLVIEAGEKSGTLITANLALEFNRDVFAVPGPIFSPQSLGTNALIKNGAKVVTSIKDILEELRWEKAPEKSTPPTRAPQTPEEEILLQLLSTDPIHIDNLAKLSKLGTVSASSILSLMEIKGWVRNIGGQNYIII